MRKTSNVCGLNSGEKRNMLFINNKTKIILSKVNLKANVLKAKTA